nr:calcium/proton exchanger [Tanacetum cinerariifolium]
MAAFRKGVKAEASGRIDEDVEAGRCAGYDKRLMKVQVSLRRLQLKPLPRNYNLGSLVTYRWIAYHYAKQLIANPFIPTLKMKNDIKEKFLINVSLRQWSICRLDDEETESGHYYFRRIYVCFKCVKEEPIVAVTPSAEPTTSVTHSTDKGKQVAKPQGKKKGSKRKAPASSEEGAGNKRIIFHKNRGRSERIFNQKMKKSGFGPMGKGQHQTKLFH